MTARDQSVGHRHFPRFPVALPVIGHGSPDSPPALPGIVRNVSRGGLLAVFREAIPPGNALCLLLQTPRGALELVGQVVWAAPQPEGVQHGIAFREPQPPGFIRGLLPEPPAPGGSRPHEPFQP